MNETLNVILRRRSVRAYSDRQLNDEDLAKIIEAGVYAPTANNDQPWHFTVIQNAELLEYINKRTNDLLAQSDYDFLQSRGVNPNFRVTYNAPTLIVVSGATNALYPEIDCAAAMENMLIAAESLGISSVWLGLLRFYMAQPHEVKKLGIPAGYEPYHAAVFGYSKHDGKPPAPQRNLDVVTYFR